MTHNTNRSCNINSQKELNNSFFVNKIEAPEKLQTLYTLKPISVLLLFKHQEIKGNKFEDLYFVNDSKNDNPIELDRAIKFILESSKSCTKLYYRNINNHDLVIVHKKEDTTSDNTFVILDSLGVDSKGHYQIIQYISNAVNNSNVEGKTSIICSTTKRQKDYDTCSIFTYKDLVALQKQPALLDLIIKSAGDIKPISDSHSYDTTDYLPEEMLRMNQCYDSTSWDKASGDLKNYIEKGKTGWGFHFGTYSKENKTENLFKKSVHKNYISEYYRNKYVLDVLPELCKELLQNAENKQEARNPADTLKDLFSVPKAPNAEIIQPSINHDITAAGNTFDDFDFETLTLDDTL